jgi:hypothetical protein
MARLSFQFNLRTLFWLTLIVASFFGGMRAQRWLADRKLREADLLIISEPPMP